MRLDLFPGCGWQDASGTWNVQVAGVLRHPFTPTMSRRVLIRMLGRAMEAQPGELQDLIFLDRVHPFLQDGARGWRMIVLVGDVRCVLEQRTRRNGHFRETLRLPPTVVLRVARTDRWGRDYLPLTVRAEQGGREVEGAVDIWLAPRDGWSAISDVDDTIKESSIRDRREMLRNTFLREFRPVAWMAAVYRDWAAAGAAFHYVSTSPCQLIRPLLQMREQADFPGGSLHLRNFRLRNHLLKKLVRLKASSKSKVILRLLENYPRRRFLLVGDSGERDLEIYAEAARRYADRVRGVLIRGLEEAPLTHKRLQRARQRLGSIPLELFDDEAGLRAAADRIQAGDAFAPLGASNSL